MKICKNCRYWIFPCEDDRALLPFGFRYCKRIKIHEGEMFDTTNNTNCPPLDTHLLICTSEWLQQVGMNSTFGCILWEPKESETELKIKVEENKNE